jgi:hypothetical protein
MEKFIYIPVTDLGDVMVSVTDVLFVYESAEDATETIINYKNGGTLTITHAADTAYGVTVALQQAIKAALATSWTNVAPVVANLGVEVTSVLTGA